MDEADRDTVEEFLDLFNEFGREAYEYFILRLKDYEEAQEWVIEAAKHLTSEEA